MPQSSRTRTVAYDASVLRSSRGAEEDSPDHGPLHGATEVRRSDYPIREGGASTASAHGWWRTQPRARGHGKKREGEERGSKGQVCSPLPWAPLYIGGGGQPCPSSKMEGGGGGQGGVPPNPNRLGLGLGGRRLHRERGRLGPSFQTLAQGAFPFWGFPMGLSLWGLAHLGICPPLN